jgi:HEAT repeat protein
MRTLGRPLACIICAHCIVSVSVFAMSSTTQVAYEGKPITEVAVEGNGWPVGVLELLNDPLRANGWNSWFSECPNDVNRYEFKLHTGDDLKQVVRKLAKIHCKTVRIELDPRKEPRGLGFTTVLPEGNGIAAVFSIGSQPIMDRWFRRLPEIEPGIRMFGVNRYTECPKACPPTLTLFIGNSVIDLAKLDIPVEVQVSGSLSESYRKEHENDPLVKAIDKFVSKHKGKQKAVRERSNDKELLRRDAPVEVLIEALHSDDFSTRYRAVYFIGDRGAQAKDAVPALIDNLETDYMVESTLHALKGIGPNASAAIPALFNSFTAYPKQPATRCYAAEALANIGESAIPTLTNGVGSENVYERTWCHAALAKIEGPESDHFKFLSDAMLSDDKATSLVAVRALTMIGPDAKTVLPQIIVAMDRQVTAKTDLAVLLARMGKDASPAIPKLVELLEHSNPMTRQRAAYALSKIGGSEVMPAVPGLIGMLSARKSYVREMAASTLGTIGPAAGRSIRPLIGRLADEDEDTRAAAARALGEIGPTDAAVLAALTAAMKDESGRVRSRVAPVLAKNAPVTKEMINVFIAASEDNQRAVMTACDIFFDRLGPGERELFPERYRLHSMVIR